MSNALTRANHNKSQVYRNFPSHNDLFLGFEKLFDDLDKFSTEVKGTQYPPYNIKRIDELNYLIEIAIAGFSKDDLDITVEHNKLYVKGNKNTEDTSEYVHKGIATRNFERNFVLANTIEVSSATMENGMLLIQLKNNIPEHKLPRSIKIS